MSSNSSLKHQHSQHLQKIDQLNIQVKRRILHEAYEDLIDKKMENLDEW